MRANEFLDEAPLPDEWDKTVFSPKTAIKKQVDYVLANAAKLGTGSARIAVTIQYQGRATALKIAKNKKGLAQNAEEARILSDGYARNMDILIPLIDHDEENDPPRWLHMEQAQPAAEWQLAKLIGCTTLSDVIAVATSKISPSAWVRSRSEQIVARLTKKQPLYKMDKFFHYVDSLVTLASDFGIDLGDFDRAANWGLYKGQPVVIDLGFSSSVRSSHYS